MKEGGLCEESPRRKKPAMKWRHRGRRLKARPAKKRLLMAAANGVEERKEIRK